MVNTNHFRERKSGGRGADFVKFVGGTRVVTRFCQRKPKYLPPIKMSELSFVTLDVCDLLIYDWSIFILSMISN